MIVDNIAIPDSTLMEKQSSRRQDATDQQPDKHPGETRSFKPAFVVELPDD